MNAQTQTETAGLVSTQVIWRLGILHVCLAVLIVYLLVCFWPEPTKTKDGAEAWSEAAKVLAWQIQIRAEIRLTVLVILGAALGSFVHSATSFATFVGNRRLVRSWLWWYLLRIPIGVGLALIFYALIRAGIMSAGETSSSLSPFGAVGCSGLIGMFSKEATDKLSKVFRALFTGSGDKERADKVINEQATSEQVQEK